LIWEGFGGWGRLRVVFYISWRWPGELPGRGVRCLAAERGEDGQQEMDKKGSGAAPEGS
jgi:hypothetical protein